MQKSVGALLVDRRIAHVHEFPARSLASLGVRSLQNLPHANGLWRCVGDINRAGLCAAQPDLQEGNPARGVRAVHLLRAAPALDCLARHAPGNQSGASALLHIQTNNCFRVPEVPALESPSVFAAHLPGWRQLVLPAYSGTRHATLCGCCLARLPLLQMFPHDMLSP